MKEILSVNGDQVTRFGENRNPKTKKGKFYRCPQEWINLDLVYRIYPKQFGDEFAIVYDADGVSGGRMFDLRFYSREVALDFLDDFMTETL